MTEETGNGSHAGLVPWGTGQDAKRRERERRRRAIMDGGAADARPVTDGDVAPGPASGALHPAPGVGPEPGDGGRSDTDGRPGGDGTRDADGTRQVRTGGGLPIPSTPIAVGGGAVKVTLSDRTAAGDPLPAVPDDGSPDPVTRGRFEYPSPEETRRRQAEDSPGAGDLDVDAALGLGVSMGASDIFIKPESPVWYQVNGVTFPSDRFRRISKETMFDMASNLITSQLSATFNQCLELDTSYVIHDGGSHDGARFRMSMIYSDNRGVETVFRYINPHIETPDVLGLSDEVMAWTRLPRGLVLVCGPTGSGKSTSLASMIRIMQTTQRRHIITIEQPVETVYPRDGLSLIDQREVGVDTVSFADSLQSAMRDAPDVILVGEMRNRQEIDATLYAADSGHLTFSTLHTKSAEETVQRLASQFSGDDRTEILSRLSANLVGVMSQQLLQRADGAGRVAVHEVMRVDRRMAKLIRKGDVGGIRDIMEEEGRSMDHELVGMMRDGIITRDEAYSHAMDPDEFEKLENGGGRRKGHMISL